MFIPMKINYLKLLTILTITATLNLTGCQSDSEGEDISSNNAELASSTITSYSWELPPDFPTPSVPKDNPISAAKVNLGRHLFYDTRISANNTFSCGTCHQPAKAFTDGKITPTGSTGEEHPRNSMTLTNVTYNSVFNWANPNLKTLAAQALVPMFGEAPIELNWSGNEVEILDRFRQDAIYRELFTQAFADQPDPITDMNVAKAIASFVSTLISGNSAADKSAYQGDTTAMSASAKRGRELFFSERLECFHCHGGFNFSQSTTHSTSEFEEIEFHNNGLYNIGGTGAYPIDNRGLWEFTFKPEDMGRFRAPTLRNIELTAPYMHDGSIATLEEVIEHYARGGRLITTGPLAGDGATNPYKSEQLIGFTLTTEEKADLINFLKSLTDWEFICDERFSDPFGNHQPHSNCQ
jgi:cytochrome c peroxidase